MSNKTFTEVDDFYCIVGSQLPEDEAIELTPKEVKKIKNIIEPAETALENQKGIKEEIASQRLRALLWKYHYVFKHHTPKKALKKASSNCKVFTSN